MVPERENPLTAPELQRPDDPALSVSNDCVLEDPQIPGSGSLVKVAVTVLSAMILFTMQSLPETLAHPLQLMLEEVGFARRVRELL